MLIVIIIVIVFFWSESEWMDQQTDEWIESWGHSSIMVLSSFENGFEMRDVKERQQQQQQSRKHQRAQEFVEVLMNSKMCPNVQTLTLLCGHEQENVYIATALSLIIIIINADDNSQLSRHSVARLWFIYTKLSISVDRISHLHITMSRYNCGSERARAIARESVS